MGSALSSNSWQSIAGYVLIEAGEAIRDALRDKDTRRVSAHPNEPCPGASC